MCCRWPAQPQPRLCARPLQPGVCAAADAAVGCGERGWLQLAGCECPAGGAAAAGHGHTRYIQRAAGEWVLLSPQSSHRWLASTYTVIIVVSREALSCWHCHLLMPRVCCIPMFCFLKSIPICLYPFLFMPLPPPTHTHTPHPVGCVHLRDGERPSVVARGNCFRHLLMCGFHMCSFSESVFLLLLPPPPSSWMR